MIISANCVVDDMYYVSINPNFAHDKKKKALIQLRYYDIAITYNPLFVKRFNLFLKYFTPVAILYMTKVIALLFLFNPTLFPKIKRMKHYV